MSCQMLGTTLNSTSLKAGAGCGIRLLQRGPQGVRRLSAQLRHAETAAHHLHIWVVQIDTDIPSAIALFLIAFHVPEGANVKDDDGPVDIVGDHGGELLDVEHEAPDTTDAEDLLVGTGDLGTERAP